MKIFIDLLKQFYEIYSPYWKSEHKHFAYLLFFSLITIIFFQAFNQLYFNIWQKEFYNAIQNYNIHQIVIEFLKFNIYVFLYAFFTSNHDYVIGYLANHWRQWMSLHFIHKWLEKDVPSSRHFLTEIDNPDQRISEDTREFTESTLKLFADGFSAVLNFLLFVYVLWQLSGTAKFTILNTHLVIPGYMIWAAILYTIIGTYLTQRIGKKLPQLNYQQEKYEADFRFELVKQREQSLNINNMDRQNQSQLGHYQQVFLFVFKNYAKKILLEKYIIFFASCFQSYIFIIGFVIAIPVLLTKHMQLGEIIQMNGAFERVVFNLSFLIISFTQLASWRAVVQRMSEFYQRINTSSLGKANEC